MSQSPLASRRPSKDDWDASTLFAMPSVMSAFRVGRKRGYQNLPALKAHTLRGVVRNFAAKLAGRSPSASFCRRHLPRSRVNAKGRASMRHAISNRNGVGRAEAIKAAEKARAIEIQKAGKWPHLWRVVGRYSNVA
jgi:hypothetical protein